MNDINQQPFPKAVKYELMRADQERVFAEMILLESAERWVITRGCDHLPVDPDEQGYFWFDECEVTARNFFALYCWNTAESAIEHWLSNRKWIMATKDDEYEMYSDLGWM